MAIQINSVVEYPIGSHRTRCVTDMRIVDGKVEILLGGGITVSACDIAELVPEVVFPIGTRVARLTGLRGVVVGYEGDDSVIVLSASGHYWAYTATELKTVEEIKDEKGKM